MRSFRSTTRMFQFVLAPLFVAMVIGEGCCPPDAWEGVAALMVGSVKDTNPHLTKGVLMLHLNTTLGMITIDEILLDGLITAMRVIQDYNKKTEYVITNGKCTKTTLKSSIPRCLPANATLVEETFLGAGSENVAVKIYKFSFRGLEIYLTVTACDCIPVVAIASGYLPDKKVSVLEVLEYSGITVGVKDPSVFDIPDICQPVESSSGYFPIMSHWSRSVFN